VDIYYYIINSKELLLMRRNRISAETIEAEGQNYANENKIDGISHAEIAGYGLVREPLCPNAASDLDSEM